MPDRIYGPCQHVLDIFPETRVCGRNSKIVNGIARCEKHPIKRIWPTDEVAA